MTRRRAPSIRAGFTLVEVIVALGLFGLISLAGFSLLRTVLDTQMGTEDRLRRMSEIQRALFVVASDLDQISGPVEGDATMVVFQKVDATGRPSVVRYSHQGDQVIRTISGAFGERTQPLLNEVVSAQWSYHLGEAGWTTAPPLPLPPLPASTEPAVPDGPPPATVRAVALNMELTGVDGRVTTVRRVIPTPEIAP